MERYADREKERLFDFEAARETAESFSAACGVSCAVLNRKGETLFKTSVGCEGCMACRTIMTRHGLPFRCSKLHLYGAAQAERFGGRYIYFCPSGLAYFASPIMAGGQAVGALVGGPALIMDVEDYLAGEPKSWQGLPAEERASLCAALECSPAMEPARLSHMSILLFSASVYVGDNSTALLAHREETAQQQDIGVYIQQLKLKGAAQNYPLAKERELVHAITEGDQSTARRLLNELLGHILFSTGGDFRLMRARAVELMVVLSRAAVDGGSDQNMIFDMNCRHLNEIDHLRTAEDLVLWLTKVTEQFVNSVFCLVDVKHKDVIYKAIEYLKRRCCEKVTLEETAGYVGLSASYFSKVFKEEMGENFNNYLSELRISKSKAILLTTNASIAEICEWCGFDDQSYFTKVFKKYTGVTPGRFRARRGRLETEKERSTGQCGPKHNTKKEEKRQT